MELEHGLEGEVSGDISVHHEEWFSIIAVFDQITSERKGTGSVHWSCLVGERKLDSKTIGMAAELFLQHVGHVATLESVSYSTVMCYLTARMM